MFKISVPILGNIIHASLSHEQLYEIVFQNMFPVGTNLNELLKKQAKGDQSNRFSFRTKNVHINCILELMLKEIDAYMY